MTTKTRNFHFNAAALAFFLISVILHCWDIGEMPPGIHVDEAAVAYNAFSVVKTGADEHGFRYPVFFKSFANYQDPVLIYSLLPFMEFCGMEKWSARLPSAIYHLLASVALFFLVDRIIRSRWISLASAFTFSLLPWIFPISRTCIGGYMPMLLGFVAAMLFTLGFVGKKSILTAIPAAFFLAFAIYSHHPGRPMAAVFMLMFILSFNVLLLKRIKPFVVFSVILGILVMPMAIYVLGNPAALTNRFNAISVWRDNPAPLEVVIRIAHRYIEYFGPQFLFISGDGNYAHSTQKTGALFIFLAPFIVLGIIHLAMHMRRNPVYGFLLLLLVSYPVAAMLTIGHRHGTACIVGSIYWMLAAAVGAKKIISMNKKIRFPILIATAVLASVEIPRYFNDYFSEYRSSSRWIFNATVYDAVEKAFELRNDNETIHISRFVFFPAMPQPDFKPEFYVVLLFLGKIAPQRYLREGIPPEIVRLYSHPPQGRGLLIRLDKLVLPDKNGNPSVVSDYEPMPERASLLWNLPTPSGIFVQIYRFSQ